MTAAPVAAVAPGCPACRRGLEPRLPQVRDPISGEMFSIDCCPACGAGVTLPVPADVKDYYAERYYGHRHSFTTRFCAWRRRRMLARYIDAGDGGRLLDVGSGEGEFLDAAARAGWTTAGIEIHPPEYGKIQPIFGTLEDAAARGPYRCVTLWHVMEHVPDPTGYAARIRSMLDSDGVLIVAVPDFGGVQARLFGRHWLHLDVPRHLYHFTAPGLRRLLQDAGFEIVGTSHQELEYDWFGWIQSAMNTVAGTPHVLFDALTGKPRRVSRLSVAASYAAGILLSFPALALTIATSLAGRGGTLIVAARPASGRRS